jgi:5-methyltetrahydrofolate--homocysteine methyltransferase
VEFGWNAFLFGHDFVNTTSIRPLDCTEWEYELTDRFRERLAAGPVLVADGATGTSYQEMGSEIGVAPEEWVWDRPERVLELHRAFIRAGSDIILTDSFGGTPLRMREGKYARRASELNRRAAELAREAAAGSDGVLVAGSIGPTGLLMEPYGELTQAAAVETFATQAAALTEGGVQLLVLETFFALDEALAAIEGMRRASALPIVVSFSFDQGTKTMMGLSPTQMVQAIAPLGVAAIGANCGKSLQAMEAVVTEISGLNSDIPLWVKPNAGLPRMDGDLARYDTTPATMAEYAGRFIELGARVVGGCCGTSPAHVAAIAQAARSTSVKV